MKLYSDSAVLKKYLMLIILFIIFILDGIIGVDCNSKVSRIAPCFVKGRVKKRSYFYHFGF